MLLGFFDSLSSDLQSRALTDMLEISETLKAARRNAWQLSQFVRQVIRNAS